MIARVRVRDIPFEEMVEITRLCPRIGAPSREVYNRIFTGYCKKLGMNPCNEAIEFLYERYYNQGRCPRASDCRDLLEIVQSICRFRRQPVQLTRDLMIEASSSFICEF